MVAVYGPRGWVGRRQVAEQALCGLNNASQRVKPCVNALPSGTTESRLPSHLRPSRTLASHILASQRQSFATAALPSSIFEAGSNEGERFTRRPTCGRG